MHVGRILVHCDRGVCRSAGIVVGQLMRENPDWYWDDALKFIREHGFFAPTDMIKKSVLDYLEKKDGDRREFRGNFSNSKWLKNYLKKSKKFEVK